MAAMENHTGPLIGTGQPRRFAYMCEHLSPMFVISASLAAYGDCEHGKVTNPELSKYAEYELSFSRHTGNALVVTLRKKLAGNSLVESRKQNGEGTLAEVFTTTLSFDEIVNRLLGPGCQKFDDREAFPDAVREAMKEAYGL